MYTELAIGNWPPVVLWWMAARRSRAAQKAGPGLAMGSAGQLAGKTQDGQAVVVDDRLKTAPTLAQAGISKDLSGRTQKAGHTFLDGGLDGGLTNFL